MKRILITLAVGTAVLSCATPTQQTRLDKATKKHLTAQSVRKRIDSRHFTVDVATVSPKGAPLHHLSGGHTLHVSGDSLYSHLPYIGRVFSAPYGGGKGLDFDATISEYRQSRHNDSCTRIDLYCKNEEDSYHFLLWIFDNGTATIDVNAQNRDTIGFGGQLADR